MKRGSGSTEESSLYSPHSLGSEPAHLGHSRSFKRICRAKNSRSRRKRRANPRIVQPADITERTSSLSFCNSRTHRSFSCLYFCDSVIRYSLLFLLRSSIFSFLFSFSFFCCSFRSGALAQLFASDFFLNFELIFQRSYFQSGGLLIQSLKSFFNSFTSS